MELLLTLTGIITGMLSGFFGIGGGTVLVPMLLLIGYGMIEAIGISIMQMVFSSVYGSYLNYKKGSLIVDDGIYVGLGGFVGGYLSGSFSDSIPPIYLKYTFVLFVLYALYRLLTSKHHTEESERRSVSKALLLGIGTVIGFFAISIGVGGSIVLTPLLAGFLHYPLKKAISAGLFFVIFSSIAGLTGRLLHGEIALYDGAIVGAGSLIGVYIGIHLKEIIDARKLRFLLVVMYLAVLGVLIYKIVTASA